MSMVSSNVEIRGSERDSSKVSPRLSNRAHGILILAATIAGIAFALTAEVRHRTYHSAALDLAFFDQIVWNTAHGRFFATSFVPYNFLGQHVQPVLLVYALLYHVWASPELLLITNAMMAAAAAIPLFAVARRILGHDGIACLVAVVYLFSPYLHQEVSFDFHPETMAPFFVFLGYRFVLDRRWRAALCAFVPLLTLKEDTALLLLGIAWLCWLQQEKRLAGTLAIIAVLWGALATLVIMPRFRIGPSDLEERYGYLGRGSAEILIGLVTHPERALAHLLVWGALLTLLALLGSIGFLPLAAPAELLAALPLLVFHLLSTHLPQRELLLQYSAEVLPLIWIAAVWGLVRARSRYSECRTPNPELLFLLCAAIAFWIGSPFPPARLFDATRIETDPVHAKAIIEGIACIPADASVSAQTGLAPHLAHRDALYDFPQGLGATYVLLDAKGIIAEPSPAAYRADIAALAAEGYAPIWSRDGVTLYAVTGSR